MKTMRITLRSGLLLTALLLLMPVMAQRKKQVKAYLDYKAFYHPEAGSYAEVHLQFSGYTISYQAVEGGLQGELALQYIFRDASGNVKKSDAYRLQTPLMRDSIVEDFYEVKRILLDPGNYELELTIADLNNHESTPISAIKEITVTDFKGKAGLSDIETAEVIYQSQQETVFTKSGYDIIPRISNYYQTEALKIPVYLEMYYPSGNDTVANVVGLKQCIRSAKSSSELESSIRYSKHEILGIQPLFRGVDISNLPTGEYELVFTMLDRENKELAQSIYYFDRFTEENTYVDINNVVIDPAFQTAVSDDSLEFYISSLIPISRQAEIKNIIALLKTKDKEAYRKYLQSFWAVSGKGVEGPFAEWMKYKAQVMKVQKLYGTNIMKGHETDRGRVYLQYGPPSAVLSRENSPTEYPYEIWRYDKIKNFSNKRFIFYNPDLVNNNYSLLHSEMLGEVQNYRWQQQLSKRNAVNRNIDDPRDGTTPHFGGNAWELFNTY